MRNYIFDASVLSLVMSNKLPEKWQRYWKDIREGRRTLILFEPLITEVFYKNARGYGFRECKQKILQRYKTLQRIKIAEISNNDALDAGEQKINFSDLSIVDCYLLTICKKYSATLFTTDYKLAQACSKVDVEGKYLPLGKGGTKIT